MDIFQNEQTHIDKQTDQFLLQLEDIGARGSRIAQKLDDCQNALKYSNNSRIALFGSVLNDKEAGSDFEKVKSELDVYTEKSAALIKDLTQMLTEIRNTTVSLWVVGNGCSGRALLLYLLSTAVVIVASWAYGVSAVVCDNAVTRAFTAEALLTCELPFYCFADRRLLDHNKSELVMYITRQSTIANSSKRFAQWTIAFFIICVMYSLYRNRRERQFRLTDEGRAIVAEDAKSILDDWLIKHGYQSPEFLNSRCLEVEYLFDAGKFAANDSRTELEYDETGSGLEDGDEGHDLNDHSTEPEASPEPSHLPDESVVLVDPSMSILRQ